MPWWRFLHVLALKAARAQAAIPPGVTSECILGATEGDPGCGLGHNVWFLQQHLEIRTARNQTSAQEKGLGRRLGQPDNFTAGEPNDFTPAESNATRDVALALVASEAESNATRDVALALVASEEHRLGQPWTMSWKAWAVAAIILVMLVVLYSDVRSPYIVMFSALVLTWAIGVITVDQAIMGFSNEAVITIGTLFVVVKGVDRSKVINRAALFCMGDETTQTMALIRMVALMAFCGSFVNSGPIVALMMPIVRDWAQRREFPASKFLMPLAFSAQLGGFVTLIGTSTNLMVDSMMQKGQGESFAFFDPVRVGAFVILGILLYLFTFGINLLPERREDLFTELRDNKEELVTELQIEEGFPLIGARIHDFLDSMQIPWEALLKVFRQPPKPLPLRARAQTAEPTGFSGFAGTIGSASLPGPAARIHILRSVSETEVGTVVEEDESGSERQPFRERAADLFRNPKPAAAAARRPRIVSEVASRQIPAPPAPPALGLFAEIFPVPEYEVLMAGDVLLLSLPKEECVTLCTSQMVTQMLEGSEEAQTQAAAAPVDDVEAPSSSQPAAEGVQVSEPAQEGLPPGGHLRLFDVDLLDVPGRQNEFAELVVSRHCPFVGRDFRGRVRRQFEKQYQVAILAVRQGYDDASLIPAPSAVTRTRRMSDYAEIGGPAPTAFGEKDEAGRLRPGDTVLVLAEAGTPCDRLAASNHFLVVTFVAKEAPVVQWMDYAPLVMFVAFLILVAIDIISMTKASCIMAAVFLLCGWVPATQLRDCVDWYLLVVIGSALGLAKGVEASGLANEISRAIKNLSSGPHAAVFMLYFFSLVLTELVHSNAAAAMGFALVGDLAEEFGAISNKPFAMAVMMGSVGSFCNPVGSPATLMVLNPGGYFFMDFLKVGIAIDVIHLVVGSLLIPVFWPININ